MVFWDNIGIGETSLIKEYQGNLYVGGDGYIAEFKGNKDNSEVIESYWTTPNDLFGYSNRLKTTNKRGGTN